MSPQTSFNINIYPAFAINELVGNTVTPNDVELLTRQRNLVASELKELTDNLEAGNFHKLGDDVGDVLFTILGFAYRAGIGGYVAQNWDAICTAQFSKFDRTERDAGITRDRYVGKGIVSETIKTNFEGVDYYVTKSSEDQVLGNGDPVGKGKWLKSYAFKEPETVSLESTGEAPFRIELGAATEQLSDAINAPSKPALEFRYSEDLLLDSVIKAFAGPDVKMTIESRDRLLDKLKQVVSESVQSSEISPYVTMDSHPINLSGLLDLVKHEVKESKNDVTVIVMAENNTVNLFEEAIKLAKAYNADGGDVQIDLTSVIKNIRPLCLTFKSDAPGKSNGHLFRDLVGVTIGSRNGDAGDERVVYEGVATFSYNRQTGALTITHAANQKMEMANIEVTFENPNRR